MRTRIWVPLATLGSTLDLCTPEDLIFEGDRARKIAEGGGLVAISLVEKRQPLVERVSRK